VSTMILCNVLWLFGGYTTASLALPGSLPAFVLATSSVYFYCLETL
jgi:hypothetical protein